MSKPINACGSEMTADEILDREAEQCVALSEALQKVLYGQGLDIAVVVLLRLAVIARHSSGTSKRELLDEVHRLIDYVYECEPGDFEETMQ